MTHDSPLTSTLDELWRDGVLQRYGGRYETTRRWRAARHRASVASEPASGRHDLGNPIVQALLALFGSQRAFDTLGPFVTAMYAVESSERRAPNLSR